MYDVTFVWEKSSGVVTNDDTEIELVYLWVQPILHWDHQHLMVRKLHEYTEAVATNSGDEVQVGEGIFGFINGTIHPIACPLFNQEIFYSRWK